MATKIIADQRLLELLNKQFGGVFDQPGADEVLQLWIGSITTHEFRRELETAGYDVEIGLLHGVDDAETLWNILVGWNQMRLSDERS